MNLNIQTPAGLLLAKIKITSSKGFTHNYSMIHGMNNRAPPMSPAGSHLCWMVLNANTHTHTPQTRLQATVSERMKKQQSYNSGGDTGWSYGASSG